MSDGCVDRDIGDGRYVVGNPIETSVMEWHKELLARSLVGTLWLVLKSAYLVKHISLSLGLKF